MNTIEEVLRKVLNDRDIFESKYDRRKREKFPKLFHEHEWKHLREIQNDPEAFEKEIEKKIQEINKDSKYHKWKRELIQQAGWLKKAYCEKPFLLKELLNTLSWYGAMECNLPGMDDYGTVIERYEPGTVKNFFKAKISAARREREALKKVLEYVCELYDADIALEEIAYFVRKIKAWEDYWEVIS